MADSVVTLGADLSELRRELAKIPNLTGEAAQDALVSLERSVKAAEVAARKATRSITTETKKASREQQKAYDDVRRGSEKVFGGVVGDVLDVKDGLLALGPASAVAGAGLLAIGASTVAIVAVAAAIIELTSEAGKLLEELDAIDAADFLTDEHRRSVEDVTAAFDAANVSVKQLQVLLSAELSPAVTEALHLLLGMSADVRDNWDTVTTAVKGASSVFARLTSNLIAGRTATAFLSSAVQVGSNALADYTEEAREAGQAEADRIAEKLRAVEAEKEAAEAARKAAEDARKAAAAEAEARRQLKAAMDAELGVIEQIQDARDRALAADNLAAVQQEIEAIDILSTVYADHTAAVQEATAAKMAILRELREQEQEDIRKAAEGYEQLSQSWSSASRNVVLDMDAVRKSARQMQLDAAAAAMETFDATIGGLAGGVSALASALAESGQLSEEAALRAYRASQAASIAQIAIQTAAGIVRQFADLPFPAALVTSASIAATGTASAITVANQPPPSFFAGGVMEASGHPDAMVVHSGERAIVETAASVRRDTGGDVRARNSERRNAGQITQINLMHSGRVAETVWMDAAQRPGSRVRKLTGSDRRGRRNRRR